MSPVLLAVAAGAAAGLAVGQLVLARVERIAARAAGPAAALGPVARRMVGLGAAFGGGPPITGRDVGRRLDAAGLSPRVTPADLAAARAGGVVAGIAGGVALLPLAGGGGLLLALLATGAAVAAPTALIDRRARRRGALMLESLPDAIDLLRVALRGGRSVPEAIAAVGAHHPGVLGDELRSAAAGVRMGVGVEDAIARLRRRCPTEGMDELVALLVRTHVHGASSVDGLHALGDDLRVRRARRAIDRANRAAPKVQLVVALLLVPAAMLVIAAALLSMR